MKNTQQSIKNFKNRTLFTFGQQNHCRKLMLICFLSLFYFLSNAQSKASDFAGKYLVPAKDGAIQIYESAGKYYGKIILNKDPAKLDVNNPVKEKQSRKILGMNIMSDFTFDGENSLQNGTIYDPKNGKTYDCKITRDEKGNINVRGFIGISLLGRTETWERLKD